MFPELPKDLTSLTDEELAGILDQFLEVAQKVKAQDADTLGDLTAEQILAEMTTGVEAIEEIRAEQSARVEAEENFQRTLAEQLTRAGVTALEEEPEDGGDEGDEDEPDTEEPEAVVEAPAPEVREPVAASARVRRPLPAAHRQARPAQAAQPEGARLVASTRIYPYAEPGETIDSKRFGQIGTELVNKNRISPGEKVVVASATFDYPPERYLDRDSATNSRRVNEVTEGMRLGVEALVASGGLCAPLTPIYTLPDVEVAARPVRDALAGFRADRGGVIVPTNPVITDYADAVGSVSAASDEAGGTFAVKNCMRIECPTFAEVQVDSHYSCIEIGNLTGRAYPELVSRVETLVAANHARSAESSLLDTIKYISLQVADPTTSAGGAAWRMLMYAHVAAAGLRSRNRMSDGARLTGLFPEWLIDLLQVDLGRADYERGHTEADARRILSESGIDAVFYKDSPTTGTSQIFAAQTTGNLLPFPAAMQWALYPAGSWLFLDSGSLDLGIVRDSTLNSTNDYQIFMETWEQAAYIGPENQSQWHTSTLYPTGTFSLGKDFSASTGF